MKILCQLKLLLLINFFLSVVKFLFLLYHSNILPLHILPHILVFFDKQMTGVEIS